MQREFGFARYFPKPQLESTHAIYLDNVRKLEDRIGFDRDKPPLDNLVWELRVYQLQRFRLTDEMKRTPPKKVITSVLKTLHASVR